MNRGWNCFVKSLICLLLAAANAFAAQPDAGASAGAPNIVLISMDTLRADHVGAYGYFRNTTPNIDLLAGRGALFENAIAQAPWTLPSHASIFTSLDPDVHGSNRVIDPAKPVGISENLSTVAEELKKNGYATAGFASFNILGFTGFERGFGKYAVLQGQKTGREWRGGVSERAISWLEQNNRTPFFLFLHYFTPHAPYAPPEEFREFADPQYSGKFAGKKEITPADMALLAKDAQNGEGGAAKQDTGYAIALYDGEIKHADSQAGSVLAWLEENGLLENTLIAVLSDHGEAFLEHGQTGHGNSAYDEEIKVPLVIAGPKVPVGARVTAQARLIDVAPTLLDAAGIAIPKQFQGRSLLPAARGEKQTETAAYSETRLRHNVRAVRTGSSKTILNLPPAGPQAAATSGGEYYEYYDLEADPGEKQNLSAQFPPQALAEAVSTKTAPRPATLAAANPEGSRTESAQETVPAPAGGEAAPQTGLATQNAAPAAAAVLVLCAAAVAAAAARKKAGSG
ncbi:MAG: sulfatase [Candidatus Micrarchaeia archaeon]|jgi:arylsulfatase A-like enzyme